VNIQPRILDKDFLSKYLMPILADAFSMVVESVTREAKRNCNFPHAAEIQLSQQMPATRNGIMPEITQKEIQRVHDLVRASLGTVEWIVAAASDPESPPNPQLVKGLIESVLDDPGESSLIGELFTSVADTREDVGLPIGLPSPNWHTAAGEIIAQVCSSILTPGGKVSEILGRPTANNQTVISPEKLAHWWPKIAAQLQPFASVRFSRFIDLLTQEFNRGMRALPAPASGESARDAKMTARGVSMRDVAALLTDGDPDSIRETKKRWQNSRVPKLPVPLGKCAADKRSYLYAPSAILKFVQNVETLSTTDFSTIKQQLQAKLRSVRDV